MLKCCATLTTPSAALQQVCGETDPFMPAELLYVGAGEQLLLLVTDTLEILTLLLAEDHPTSLTDLQVSRPLLLISPASSLLRKARQQNNQSHQQDTLKQNEFLEV